MCAALRRVTDGAALGLLGSDGTRARGEGSGARARGPWPSVPKGPPSEGIGGGVEWGAVQSSAGPWSEGRGGRGGQ